MLSSTDLPLSPDSPLLSDSADIDFGCDSGIEAEMDEPHGKMHLFFLLYFIHADIDLISIIILRCLDTFLRKACGCIFHLFPAL